MSPIELPKDDSRPGLKYPLHETRMHKIIVVLARNLFRMFMKMNIDGLENVPRAGGAIVAANHLVMFDVFPLQLALPRMIFYMGKAELFQNGLIHAVFRHLGAFPVYRGERDTWALEHARKILRSGQMVAMFPEGTRSRGKGLALARPGTARLAIETSCPILVVSINGIQNLFKNFPHKTIVNVSISPLIFPRHDDSPLSLTDKMMFTMAGNLPTELRGVYTDMPENFS